MNKQITILTLILLSCCSCKQETTQVVQVAPVPIVFTLSQEVKDLRDTLALVNRVDYKHTGYSGDQSKQYLNFRKLTQLATDEELLLLLKDSNEVVVTYTAKALLEREHPAIPGLFKHWLEDDLSFTARRGCFTYSSTLTHLLYWDYRDAIRDRVMNEGNQFSIQGLMDPWDYYRLRIKQVLAQDTMLHKLEAMRADIDLPPPGPPY